MANTISATRAALLGQLAWRSQTPYELTNALAQNVRFIWPRAHSHVYREVKRLAELGMVSPQQGSTGRRRRTVYSITRKGRQALRAWLASEAGGIALQHEPLLRVLNASAGRREDLLRAVARARAEAAEMLAIGSELGQRYLDGTHERQLEVHLRVFTFDYLYRWGQLTLDWADRVEAEVTKWDDLDATPAKERRALSRITAILKSSP